MAGHHRANSVRRRSDRRHRLAKLTFWPYSRRTPPVVFNWPSITSGYVGAGLRRRSSISRKITWNKLLGTATSAGWKVTQRPCPTTLAPIFISFSRNVVINQCLISMHSSNVRLRCIGRLPLPASQCGNTRQLSQSADSLLLAIPCHPGRPTSTTAMPLTAVIPRPMSGFEPATAG